MVQLGSCIACCCRPSCSHPGRCPSHASCNSGKGNYCGTMGEKFEHKPDHDSSCGGCEKYTESVLPNIKTNPSKTGGFAIPDVALGQPGCVYESESYDLARREEHEAACREPQENRRCLQGDEPRRQRLQHLRRVQRWWAGPGRSLLRDSSRKNSHSHVCLSEKSSPRVSMFTHSFALRFSPGAPLPNVRPCVAASGSDTYVAVYGS